MISCRIFSDDHSVEVDLDVTSWFEQASDEEIVALSSIDWGYDYEADNIAYFFSKTNQDVKFLLEYVTAYNLAHHPQIGFECEVNSDSANEWLKFYRPAVYAKLFAVSG